SGSVTEFMARCPGSSCDGVDAASLDWFKIAEETWDGTQWPTERISQTKSYAFTVPSDLAAG
ncbi:UNVERIFIED_CONTAM: lytic polysaccharide monooxygenase auxiliary activity family 9 protein, partial [Bacteroidetes bacterium 56_B9]